MTGATWLDVILIALVLLAVFSGWVNGAAASAFGLLGVLVGATSGLLLAPHLVGGIENPLFKLMVGLLIVGLMVLVGQVAGVTIGRAIRGYITSPPARFVDSVVGAGIQAVALLIVAWLLAVPVANQESTEIGAAVRNSEVLSKVDDYVPDAMHRVPATFSDVLDESGFPDVLGPFGETPMREVEPPDPALAGNPVVEEVRPSVLRVMGRAPVCQRALEGTGFVIGPGRVMTNAHVVAGTDEVRVDTVDGTLRSEVVAYDPDIDLAVLDVPGLAAPPLEFVGEPVPGGTDALVVGYPGNGPYRADAARVRELVTLRGPNIYRDATVEREVYIIRGNVREGNSGGPLLTEDGRVIGVIFGAALDASDTGYVLTESQVAPYLGVGGDAVPVATGDCVGAAR